MSDFILECLGARSGDQFALHEEHLNRQMVRVLRTIGYDRNYVRAKGPYLFDSEGERYLDLLSGFGVFALGRNHPTVNAALIEVLSADLPNLIQLDVSLLAGLLSEELVKIAPTPELDRVFFANSGAETVEAAIKFARVATKRPKILCCNNGYHGLTYGALSITGDKMFRGGFGPFLDGCGSIPFNDLAALEEALAGKDAAAFVVEPIQGKGVILPDDDYLAEAARLCRRAGTLFVADEVQTGLGRTGKMWAVEHYGAEPDMVLSAKALSGGQAAVGAVLMRSAVFDAVFDRMDRAVVHGSTFGKNNLAMAAGLATLKVLAEEDLVRRAAVQGDSLRSALSAFVERYEFVHDVRGKGLMIGLEFGKPTSFRLQAAWSLLEKANVSLFSQMILIPLFKDHKILAQVASHGQHVIKLLPPLVIDDDDVAWITRGFDTTIADCHKIPGAIWDLGRRLAGHAMASNAKAQAAAH
ncbi:MAG: aspartate aminotransferase family protein [Pseudomonadota bacterium]